MTDFKIGDKVRIIAAEDTERYKNGDILTVSDLSYGEEVRHVMVICADGKQELAYLREIEPYTPDVITINRADLPEVTEVDGSLHCGENHYFTDPKFGAAKHRQLALQQLAVAEFIEARDKAAEEAEAKRGKRRDELAAELAPRAYETLGANWYGNVGEPLQKAIDRIIDLEASHD